MNYPEILAQGVLEIMPAGHGFLRSDNENYQPATEEEIYVSPSTIRSFGLRTGDEISGRASPLREGNSHFLLVGIDVVNSQVPAKNADRAEFENLTSVNPTSRLTLETTRENLCGRIIDLFAPIGLGQTGLIAGPARSGKSLILENIANAVALNHPKIVVLVVLLDCCREEAEALRRCLRGKVIFSTPDEPAVCHVHLAELVMERAKRLVEDKHDVLILLDSLTSLASAYQAVAPSKQELSAGQFSPWGMEKAKRFFESARTCKEGGSLTILATIETETRLHQSDSLFKQLQGVSDIQIALDRKVF